MQSQDEPAPAAPVFVDPTGRRSRRVQRVLWALSAVLGCYLALVAVSLVGTPGLSRLTVPGVGPVLPGPAAPQLGTTSGRRRAPARLLPPAVSAQPSPRPSSAAASSAPQSSVPPVPAASAGPSPARAPVSPAPSPVATPLPRATPSTAATATPAPASNRPSPRNSRAPTARPSRPAR